MTTDNLKMILQGVGVSQAELARRIGETPQGLNKKMKRNSFSDEDYRRIAKVLGIEYVSYMTLPDGQRIGTTPEVFNKWKDEQ